MDWREDCLQRIARSSGSGSDIVKELAGIVQGLGFEYCSYVLRVPFPIFQPKVAWASTYPKHWLDHYFSNGYLSIDPLLKQIARSPGPVVWSSEAAQSEPAFWEEARGHGVKHGWAMATYGASGTTGMISLARSNDALTEKELGDSEAQLVWLAQAAHSVVSGLEMAKFQLPISRELSAREKEVLRWTAAGKTAAEIGVILKITERTVNFHVTRALMKLNAINKVQAVMTATMLGLLF